MKIEKFKWYSVLDFTLLDEWNSSYTRWQHSMSQIRGGAAIHFAYIDDVRFTGTISILGVGHINLAVQYTRGACAEIHQRILLSSEEIIDLLQAVNTVLVKAQRHVPLSLWSCNDKMWRWKPQKVSAHCQRPHGWDRHSFWRLLWSSDDG